MTSHVSYQVSRKNQCLRDCAISPFMSAESTPRGGHWHSPISKQFCRLNIFPFFLLLSVFFYYNRKRKTRMLLLQGIHQFLFLYSSPEVTIISTATNCDVSRRIDFCLFICPSTHGWIGYRQISFPFPFSSHPFNKDDFNKAPFPICSTETIHKNNFKFNASLEVNFVDKENNIKVTEMSIILPCTS